MTAIQGVVSEKGANQKIPPGVLVEGPLVDAKLREIYVMFGILYAGSIAGLVWTIMQGIGWVEIAVFVGMFWLTMFGMGAGVHRLLVHRSFRCGPVMRAFFCGDRYDGGTGFGAQMGCQSSPAPSSRRQTRRCPQPAL